MKTKLHLLMVLLWVCSFTQAQETTVNLSMAASYANQVYYKLNTQTETTYAANSWDISMLRTDNFAFSLRINDHIGVEVFEASNKPNDWNSIDIANEASWTKLYNSDIKWNEGAFDKGSATYGWGEYNIATHHVEGTIIFVLKYADGTYRKFINDDYFGGHTFRYSTWNSGTSTWSADQTATVSNTTNPNNSRNYYSFENNTEVIAEPATTDWDLKFTKYYTEVPNGSGGTQPYLTTGVLVNSGLEVAENDEPGGMPANPNLTYATNINTIGYDWKTFDFSSGWLIDSNKAFYVKYADNTIYRLYFTAFSGSGTGDLTFKFEDVTASLDIEDITESISFGVFPNPSPNKQINLVYDVNKWGSDKNKIAIFSTTGQKVFETSLKSNSGLFNKTLDFSALKSGVYILQFSSGNHHTSKKLVLN
ncbi:T9SS type A sorting domain-containing protein [Flavivirga eckloniae]|uniref:T9SS C-terminal target domain-containing protein n=1 Tax=Flavivirga eckloniae TaxID=1803846 RepID=A0A2K9PU89_9FLAO|nr:T9SS type A sorting domain-containing protein [Flavivirga eckloniae]AUP80623.1 T9SS C-terminal target domain-containing protein [Flavivirga eckloniae]